MQSSGLSGSESTQILYYDIMNDFCFCTYNARECLTEKGMSCICKHILAAKLAGLARCTQRLLLRTFHLALLFVLLLVHGSCDYVLPLPSLKQHLYNLSRGGRGSVYVCVWGEEGGVYV